MQTFDEHEVGGSLVWWNGEHHLLVVGDKLANYHVNVSKHRCEILLNLHSFFDSVETVNCIVNESALDDHLRGSWELVFVQVGPVLDGVHCNAWRAGISERMHGPLVLPHGVVDGLAPKETMILAISRIQSNT